MSSLVPTFPEHENETLEFGYIVSQIKIRFKIRLLLWASFFGRHYISKISASSHRGRPKTCNTANINVLLFFFSSPTIEEMISIPGTARFINCLGQYRQCKIPGMNDYKPGICSSLSVFKYHLQVLYVRSLSQLPNDCKWPLLIE